MDKSAVVTPTTPLMGIKKLAKLSGLALFLWFHAGRVKIQQIIIDLENKTFSTGKRGSMAIWQLVLVKEVNFKLIHTRLEDLLQKIAGFLHKSSTAQIITSCHTAEVCIICHLLCLQGNFLFSDSGMCDGITSIPHNCQPRAPFSKVLETFQAWKAVLCLSCWYSTSRLI